MKSNEQVILKIDFDRTYLNALGSLTFRRFGISKYHKYLKKSEILSNVTERGFRKLFAAETMDVRFGRSIGNHSKSFHYYFALSMKMMNHIVLQVHNYRVK